MDPDEPFVEVSAVRLVCASHGEHLRAQWPKGAAIMFTVIPKAALEGEALAKAVRGRGPRRRRGELDVARVNKVTEKMPFCYFVDRSTLRNAFLDANILSEVTCALCGHTREGGPYTIAYPGGPQTKMVCLECALDSGEREHKARPHGIRRDAKSGAPI